MSAATRCKFHTGAASVLPAGWVSRRLWGHSDGFDACVVMSVWREAMLGAVVFHNYQPEAGVMEMSAAAASPRWLTRSVLQTMHGYVFDDAGCQLAVLRVSENNKRMLRIAQAYGYRAFRIPRLRGRDEAEIILTLAEEDWRASRFHRVTAISAAA